MALSSGTNPVVDGLGVTANGVTANSSESGLNQIYPAVQSVVVSGITVSEADFLVLPALTDVPVGHKITINNQSGKNIYLRTPASSNGKINDVDCDGASQYPLTDTNVLTLIKRSASGGWIAYEHTKLGAVVTAVVPAAHSLSPSISPSVSPSVSKSPSLSPSASPSVSPSVSVSPSISPSVSPSVSISPSLSPSVSPSASVSPSVSVSPSTSPSVSPSVSASPSVSPSVSVSPSLSPSISPSISPSFSPSANP